MVLILLDAALAAYVAAALFVVGAATDGLDGYLARRYRSTTRLGQWLDPLADKVLVAATVITLTVARRFPLWATVVIVARELGVSLLRAWLGTRGRAMPASWLGKWKTVAQMLAIVLYLLPTVGTPLGVFRFWVLVVAVALTIWSGIDYVVKARRPSPDR